MSTNSFQAKILETPPIILKFSKWLQRKNIRGGYRLENFSRNHGWLDFLVEYSLTSDVRIQVPIAIRSYDSIDIIEYEKKSISFVTDIVSSLNYPITLIDCGADIGLVTARFVSCCNNIHRVIAFEPNKKAYTFLKQNMRILPIEAEARKFAVADYTGKGRLIYPDFDNSDHAAFLFPCETGDIDVVRIDDLHLDYSNFIFLKVDVEGGELQVIQGASRTLSMSKGFVVVFEAHPRQCDRTGIDPIQIVSFLKSLKQCQVQITEQPGI